MSSFKKIALLAKFRMLELFNPNAAGRLATKLFITSRNAANPQRKGFTPMGAKKISLDLDGSKVKDIYVWGDSEETVLLLHGWGSDCSSMFGFISDLRKSGYRVATFDAPAHGSSEGEYASMSEYMLAAQRAIEVLGDVKKIIAHSLGCIIAVSAASKFQNINKFVLVSAPYSLTNVLDIWSSGFMRLSDGVRENIYKELKSMNGVPVSFWTIDKHTKNGDLSALVIHDENDPVVKKDFAYKVAGSFKNFSINFTKELGHAKILASKEVHSMALSYLSNENSEMLDRKLA